jgi:DNA-binding transcriptional MerR regulator
VGAGVTDAGDVRFRIGEVAKQAGVSTRTLRYYQELGLLDPAGLAPGGGRRYSSADVARLRRILELRDVMGFDLERIRAILGAEDRRAGVSLERRKAVVREAITINDGMRRQVHDKLAELQGFLADLEEKANRYRDVAAELEMDVVSDRRPPGARKRRVPD